ncbi:murein DD-endopeptidase [Vibrio xiamenensis]|uniref:Murein DD-endopeptidase n=2 Tax=Vibrio xiamenensis TaxID=861298 RepID=A0A1G8DRB0_9VIBR|nr:murein DD-endopeptidase [Vibrio xiamenensis]
MLKPVSLSILCLFLLATSAAKGMSFFWSESDDAESMAPKQSEPLQEVKSVFSGQVDYSFISSVLDTGVSSNEVKSLLDLTTEYFNVLNKSSKGDWFAFKTDIDTNNQTIVRAFYYRQSDEEFFVYRGYDNNIYDKDGFQFNSLKSLQMPFKNHYRISSSFSLKRRHPVTHRLAPHYGTDYATPVGTQVLAIASGKVIRTRYDHFAGNYITIEHGNGIVSRYMHLLKTKVKRGDFVNVGDVIALSGNTGRTTGPHLHVELIYNGVPIDFAKTQRQYGDVKPLLTAQSLDAVDTFEALKSELETTHPMSLTRR